jgi:hypothetical protein
MGQPRDLIGLSKQYPLQRIDMSIRSNLKMLREFLLTRKKWWLSPVDQFSTCDGSGFGCTTFHLYALLVHNNLG